MRIVPVDLRKIEEKSNTVYEGVIVSALKARQINDDNKLEFNTLVNSMIGPNDDEFDERGNPDQLKVSLEFEKRPKPHLVALHQLLDGEIEYRYKEEIEK